MANNTVLNFFDQASGNDNVLNLDGTWKIGGTAVTATASQLNNLEGGDAATGITAFATGGQGSATALTAEFNNVTTVASNFDSVKLPTASSGARFVVKNSGASILSLFPNTSDSINALAVNLSVDIPVGGEMTFRGISATVWETVETFYSSAPTTQTGGLEVKAADSAGNTVTTITNASQAAARTYTIPDGGASANFVLSEGAATINGVKTFGAAIVIPDITDFVKFLGLGDVILFGTGTFATTRVAQGDYVSRKSAADDTSIIGIDITEILRTTASKGLELTSFDVIFRNING